jgi:hypothetical protein
MTKMCIIIQLSEYTTPHFTSIMSGHDAILLVLNKPTLKEGEFGKALHGCLASNGLNPVKLFNVSPAVLKIALPKARPEPHATRPDVVSPTATFRASSIPDAFSESSLWDHAKMSKLITNYMHDVITHESHTFHTTVYTELYKSDLFTEFVRVSDIVASVVKHDVFCKNSMFPIGQNKSDKNWTHNKFQSALSDELNNRNNRNNRTRIAQPAQITMHAYILYLYFKTCRDPNPDVTKEHIQYYAKTAHIGKTVVESAMNSSAHRIHDKGIIYDILMHSSPFNKSLTVKDVMKQSGTMNVLYSNKYYSGSWLFKMYEYEDLGPCEQHKAQTLLFSLLHCIRPRFSEFRDLFVKIALLQER